jgi:hypothetical protein
VSIIQLFNSLGEEINLSLLGIEGQKLIVPSPSYLVTSEKIDGRPGEMIVEKTLDSRKLIARFIITSPDYIGSLESRNQLYELFGSGEVIYVAESSLPTKRWAVDVDGWTPERINISTMIFDVPLLATSGTAESVNIIERTFFTSTFNFKNEGNVLIDPNNQSDTEIEFKGSSTNLIIRNLSTGDEWSWTGTTVVGDTILLKGARSTKNGISIFGQTNKKLITLAPNWNDFEIVGATGVFELTIRTRFYFL